MNQDDPERLVKLLADHEDLLSKLYQRYAELIPDRDIWKKLVKDEHIHYQWIMAIYQKTKDNKVYIKTDRFPIPAVESSAKYINKLISEASSHSLIEALGMSNDLEHAMIEQKYFEVFETELPEIKHMIKGLIEMTKMHIRLIEEELENTKLIVETKQEESKDTVRQLILLSILLVILGALVYYYIVRF